MGGSKNMKKVVTAIAGYTIGTFVLAVVWHIVLFKKQYEMFQYIETEPNFALGLSSILLQAIVLSLFYQHIHARLQLSAFHYVAVMGIFFWTSHVLAFIAKQDVANAHLFVGMETVYLALQFGLYGLILRWLYRS